MLFVKRFYFIAAVLGTLVPWAFFADYFYSNGFAPMAFLGTLCVNGAAGGFSADILISILVFWVWATRDARRHGVNTIGSFTLPNVLSDYRLPSRCISICVRCTWTQAQHPQITRSRGAFLAPKVVS